MLLNEGIDVKFEPHKQCEIRRPSPEAVLTIEDQEINKPAGYYFDIVWIEADLARKNNKLQDREGNIWTVYEVHGSKRMPRDHRRMGFKQVSP